MKGGHKPQPPSEKRARGTFRPDRDGGKIEVVIPTALPVQPTWLTEAGQQEWLDLIGRVASTRLATEIDSALLGTLANLLGAMAQAWQSDSAPPASYITEARRLAELFGLAGAKSRVGAPAPRADVNPFMRTRPKPDAP